MRNLIYYKFHVIDVGVEFIGGSEIILYYFVLLINKYSFDKN